MLFHAGLIDKDNNKLIIHDTQTALHYGFFLYNKASVVSKGNKMKDKKEVLTNDTESTGTGSTDPYDYDEGYEEYDDKLVFLKIIHFISSFSQPLLNNKYRYL